MANLALMDATYGSPTETTLHVSQLKDAVAALRRPKPLSDLEEKMLVEARNTPAYEGYEAIIQEEDELWNQ